MKRDVSFAPRTHPAALTNVRMFRSRQALRRALLALLEREQFGEISIRDIVAEAGVGYATFFRHHASKEDLLREIAAEQVSALVTLVLPLVDADDTRRAALATCVHVNKQRAIWSALTGGAGATLRTEFVRLAQAWAPKIPHSGWLPVAMGAACGVASTLEILSWWLRQPPGVYSPEQVADFLDHVVIAPLTLSDRPDKARPKRARTAKHSPR